LHRLFRLLHPQQTVTKEISFNKTTKQKNKKTSHLLQLVKMSSPISNSSVETSSLKVDYQTYAAAGKSRIRVLKIKAGHLEDLYEQSNEKLHKEYKRISMLQASLQVDKLDQIQQANLKHGFEEKADLLYLEVNKMRNKLLSCQCDIQLIEQDLKWQYCRSNRLDYNQINVILNGPVP